MSNLRWVWKYPIFTIMTYQKRKMLNRLQRLLPEGLLADAAWFTAEGYPSSLRSRYLSSGWLEPVTRGVFRRPLKTPGLEHMMVPFALAASRDLASVGLEASNRSRRAYGA